jgi:hypothetical protein
VTGAPPMRLFVCALALATLMLGAAALDHPD